MDSCLVLKFLWILTVTFVLKIDVGPGTEIQFETFHYHATRLILLNADMPVK